MKIYVKNATRNFTILTESAEIVEQYPRLTEGDVRAALAFAADYLANEIAVAAE